MVLVEGSEKWLDFVYSLKVELVRFGDGLGIRFKRKEGVKVDLMIHLNDWKNGIAIFSMEKMAEGVGLDCGCGQEIIVDLISLICPLDFQVEMPVGSLL